MLKLGDLIQRVRDLFPLPSALLVGIVVIWAVGILGPRLSKLESVSSDLDRALQVAAERRRLIADRERIVAAHEGLTTEESEHQGEREPDATTVMRSLTRKNAGGSVRIVRMTPSRSETVGNLRQIGAEVELKGNLEALVRYFYDVEYGTDPLTVTYLNLRIPPSDHGELEARISVAKLMP